MFTIVIQAMEEAQVTMLMGLHLTMTMMISQTPALRIRPSDKRSSERYCSHAENVLLS